MDKIIKSVLINLEKEGYEAYIVGGYVRDLLVGLSSYDIDICTNATPKDLMHIFPSSSSKNIGGISFKIKEYHFEITTYREEIKYKERRPVEFNYVNNLIVDLQRRDFTINAICMNSKGETIDLVGGSKDLMASKVKMIGDTRKKIKEDPLRILRAIRIATILNFNLDATLYKEIKSNKGLILTLSSTRIKEELDKILLSKNVKKGLNLLKDLGILNLLKISNWEKITPVKSLEGMYAQLTIGYPIPFSKVEKNNLSALKEILKKGYVDKLVMYEYGLYLSQIAGEILKMNSKEISKIYRDLPIHNQKEINIKAPDIVSLLNIDYSKKVREIIKELEILIINGKIRNKKNDLKKYIIDYQRKWLK